MLFGRRIGYRKHQPLGGFQHRETRWRSFSAVSVSQGLDTQTEERGCKKRAAASASPSLLGEDEMRDEKDHDEINPHYLFHMMDEHP